MQKITRCLWFDGSAEKDAEKPQRVMKAMLQMDKIDIARLSQATEQR